MKLGPSTLGRVVVESGLAAGDLLALRDPTRPAGAPAGAEAGAERSAAPAGGAAAAMITIGMFVAR